MQTRLNGLSRNVSINMNRSVRDIRSFSDLPEGVSLKFLGIVPSDSGRSGGMCGKSWTFSMDIDAWKVVGGPLIKSRVLLVFRKLNESQIDSIMEKLDDMSLISFVAQRPKSTAKPKEYPQPIRLELEAISVSKTQDRDLRNIKAKHTELTQLEDPDFGTIVYDSLWKSYYVQGAIFKSSRMCVAFAATNQKDLQFLLSKARPFWSQRLQWFNEWREFVYQSCFEVASEHWIETTSLTKKNFLKHLGWPCGVTFFRRKGKFGFELQGNNAKIFENPGVFVYGTSIKKFDTVSVGDRE